VPGKGGYSIGKEISPVPVGTGTLAWSPGQKGLGEAKTREFDLQMRKVSYAESQERDERCLTAPCKSRNLSSTWRWMLFTL